MYIIQGDLIKRGLKGEFDVIVHGANCFCLMGVGIAKQVQKTFDTLSYNMEAPKHKGDINKLGTIDWVYHATNNESTVIVVNAYTQYHPGADARYNALLMCLEKINHMFKGKRVGFPLIGAGIGGLNKEAVIQYIEKTMKDCETTLVLYKPE